MAWCSKSEIFPGKVHRRWVLVAYGALPSGKRQILATTSRGRSETAWLEFLQDLYLRGLHGKNLKSHVTMVAKGCALRCQWSFPVFRNTLLGPQAAQHRRKSSPQGRLLRGRSRRHLSRSSKNQALWLSASGDKPGKQPPSNAWPAWNAASRAPIELFQRAESHWKKVRPPTSSERPSAKCADAPVPCPASPIPKAATHHHGVHLALNTSWEKTPFFEFTQTT